MSDSALDNFYQRYIEVLNRHEFDRMVDFVEDHVTLNSMPSTRDEIIAVLSGITDAVPDFQWTTQEVVIDGNRLAARLINTGTPIKEWLGAKPNGNSFRIVEFAVYEVREGRFVHLSSVHDAESLHRQLTG
ncbi:hypothetical protein GCM10009555_062190 [Acrocarpospora macrocephala]|uniref:Ester cyclase n=1 Tax=Acrocarpospora macrocephala TaxID=150177 RepID=A0A5M3WNK9_9ACTN|nr:ester cyclase [Acrocarpospora macrocephala]GES09662.1 hypothetical protein Amac_032580 [Acrocarpospora macrocephala]